MGELETFVRDQISRYVAGVMTLEALGSVLPDGWDFDEADEPEARRLVLLTLGYLTDCQRGSLAESEIRQLLSAEASWRLERTSSGVNPARQPDRVETQVRADARTALQEVLAS